MLKHSIPLCLAALLALAGCSDDANGGKQDSGPGTTDSVNGKDTSAATCATKKLLPADGKVGDFKLQKTEAADDGKSLQALINGGSDKYERNKFKCMVKAAFASATKKHKIEVWIFDQTDSASAKKAYDDSKHADDADLATTLGDASRENTKLLFEYTADMLQGKYVVRIKIDDKKEAADGPLMLKEVEAAIKAAK